MSEQLVLVERTESIATVTLNRPEALNALSMALRQRIAEVFAELDADDSVEVVILTGAGRAFTVGLDLKELGGEVAPETAINNRDLGEVIGQMKKPVIGAVNGFAITGGFEIALMCDFLIASPEAKFADTHARVGVVPGWGLSQRLPRLIGINRAKEVSLSGNALTAERAYEWGLANRICEPDALLDEARALAADICSCVPGVMEQVKTMIDTGYSMLFDDAMEYELQTGIESSKRIDSAEIGQRHAAIMERGRKQ